MEMPKYAKIILSVAAVLFGIAFLIWLTAQAPLSGTPDGKTPTMEKTPTPQEVIENLTAPAPTNATTAPAGAAEELPQEVIENLTAPAPATADEPIPSEVLESLTAPHE